jgi:rare lipoprotein A
VSGGARPGAALFLLLLATACASGRSSRPVSHPIPPGGAPAGWSQEGLASWYGGNDGFEGKPTASGEIYDSAQLTAAHRDLPLGTVVDVTNVENGKTVRVRVNDRGPFVHGRVIDLSRQAARHLDLIGPGVGMVRLTVVSPGVAPTPVPPAVAAGEWAVQVGSFGEKPRADKHLERLEAAGFTAYLEPYQGLTRVKVGPVDSRSAAEAKLVELEDAGFEESWCRRVGRRPESRYGQERDERR